MFIECVIFVFFGFAYFVCDTSTIIALPVACIILCPTA